MERNIERNAPTPEGRAAARASRGLTAAVRARRAVGQVVEPGHGEQRQERDAQGRETTQGPVVHQEDEPATGDEAVDAAYDFAGRLYGYLYDLHQRRGPDGGGSLMESNVRYGRNWDNAAFDGQVILIGEGGIFPPFWLAPDVFYHEWGHWFTQATCGLGYENDEAGGNNEHGSDWLAATVDQWVRGESAEQGSWLIGPALFSRGLQGRGLRDMLHPGTAYDDPVLGRDPQPATYDQYRPSDPHLGSAIGNLAFATAAQAAGGNTWETVGPVWYDCWVRRMSRTTTFRELALATVAAATERYGEASPIVTAVRAGWDAAKVPLTGSPPDPDPDPQSDCDDLFRSFLQGATLQLTPLARYVRLERLPDLLRDEDAVHALRSLARTQGARDLLARARLAGRHST